MAVSKKRIKILFIILIILMALFLGVNMVRKLPKQIQVMIKNKVSSYVVKNQAELYKTVLEMDNEMNNLERGYVYFPVFYYQFHSSRFYRCGFYYSEEDVSVDVLTGDYVDSGTTVYETWPIFMLYWYRADKIMDNWWYYEEWWKIMPNPHRSIKEEIIGFIEYYLIDEVFPPEFCE